MRHVFLIQLLLSLYLPASVLAEVEIPLACRVENLPPGRCGWCALETLARYHHIRELYGVVAKHASNARPKDLERVVAATGAGYRIQPRGSRDTEILEKSIREDYGAAVGFRPLVAGGRGHVVILIDFGDKTVRILDPNDRNSAAQVMKRSNFLERWDGFALVLERPEAHKGH